MSYIETLMLIVALTHILCMIVACISELGFRMALIAIISITNTLILWIIYRIEELVRRKMR